MTDRRMSRSRHRMLDRLLTVEEAAERLGTACGSCAGWCSSAASPTSSSAVTSASPPRPGRVHRRRPGRRGRAARAETGSLTMAHIEKRMRGGQATYRARYRAPDGTERNKTFRRKVDAEKFLATVESAKLRGAWTDPAAGRTPFAAWLEEWWGSAADLRPSTVSRDERLLRLVHVAPLRRGAVGRDPAAGRAGVGGRAVGAGLQAGHGGQGLPAPRPHDDGGGQRRHAAPLAMSGGAAAQGRAGGDAVPQPGSGRHPG